MIDEDQIREAYDDPFRLARAFAADRNGMRFWKGKCLESDYADTGPYEVIYEEDVKLALTMDIKATFDCESRDDNRAPDKVTTKVVSDVMLALKALVYVPSEERLEVKKGVRVNGGY
jgi:hypothetical protein